MLLEVMFHFIRLVFDTRSEAIFERLQGLFTSCDQSALLGQAVVTCHFSLEEANGPYRLTIEPLQDAMVSDVYMCHGVTTYYGEHRFIASDDADFPHQTEYHVAQNRVKINLDSACLVSWNVFLFNVLTPLLRNLVFPFNGLVPLHGAVLTKADKTVFLAGRTGAGKTTLALQLLKQGFGLISDDAPVVSLGSEGVHVLSSLDGMWVSTKTLSLFPDVAAQVDNFDITGKQAVPRTGLGKNSVVQGRYRVTHILQLERRAFETYCYQALPKNRLVHALMQDTLRSFWAPGFLKGGDERFKAYNRFVFQAHTQLVQRAETGVLQYSEAHSLEEVGRLIEALT